MIVRWLNLLIPPCRRFCICIHGRAMSIRQNGDWQRLILPGLVCDEGI